MMPRPAQCDDDRCDYDENGTWRHHPRCATQDPWAPEDMAVATAREDGYVWCAPVVHLAAQPERRRTA